MGNTKLKTMKSQNTYSKFNEINGEHPFKKNVPEAVVEYKVRTRHGGEVAFFNFDLAREIGLIPEDHPDELTKDLREQILHTFSIQIINEYDLMNNVKIAEEDVREHTYMATRYLQLQHPCKKGTTSGDGRSIWNGFVASKGKFWDISSCGTGATKLSPACNINKKFYQTGDPTVSYGCGYSEKDEGLSSLFFSEILAQNGLKTERVLAVIEFAKGIAINVRAHENLMRPSHMFNHLKQNNLPTLKKVVDYYIDRQFRNKAWSIKEVGQQNVYDYFLEKVTLTFSEMSANFEDDYIFCWLDWDGDNILMDGGIIDYGSVRQFGLYHHEYRYDDVQRWSTSIKEQKSKARYIVQNFAQIVDYIKNEKKKPIESFKNHPMMKRYDSYFEECKDKNILRKIGFTREQSELLVKHASKDVHSFRREFSYFEKAKSSKGLHKVPDGVNWNAIYCMRDILRELPQFLVSRGVQSKMTNEEFIEVIKSNYATKEDVKRTLTRDFRINRFQQGYKKLINRCVTISKVPVEKVLLSISMRSAILNKYDRVTGDSITTIVAKVMSKRPKLEALEILKVLKEFKAYQNLNPDLKKRESNFTTQKGHSPLVKGMLQIVRDYREGI